MIAQGARQVQSRPRPGLASLELWRDWALLVSAAGLAGWLLIGAAMMMTLGIASVAAGTVVGILVGVGQAHVLTSRLGAPRAAWIVMSLLAGTAGWSLSGHGGFSILRSDANEAWTLAMGAAGGLAAGLVAGLLQWPVLRKGAPHSWLWIPVNGLAWAGAVVVGMLVFNLVYQGYYGSGDGVWGQPRWWAMALTAGGTTGTIVLALLTGTGLVWLMRGGKPLATAALMALASVALVVPAGLEMLPSLQQQTRVSQGAIGMEQAPAQVQVTSAAGCGDWQFLEWPDLGPEPVLYAPWGFDRALQGIAASPAGDIWAIGSRSTGGDVLDVKPQAVLAHWDGARWSQATLPATLAAGGQMLRGITALSKDDVWAVGADFSDRQGSALVLHYNGTGWSRVPNPSPGDYSLLYSVAAGSPEDVWAVGSTGSDRSNLRPLALHWNGKQWSIESFPSTAGGLDVGFYGVAALGPNDVWAVGAVEGEQTTPLIAHWDGKTWAWTPVPGDGLLYSVTVSATDDAWAVGTDFRGLGFGKVLALHWDGKSWNRVPMPLSGEVGAFEQVVARAPGDVWAAGWLNLSEAGGRGWGPLIAHWDGKAWSQVPLPQHREQDYLYGLAVPATGPLWVAGATTDDSYQEKAFGLIGRLQLSKCEGQP